MKAPAPHLTVAICTYNRCERLGATLATLASQSGADGGDYEILIVDNNSDDATQRVAQAFVAPARRRVVRESRQGLAHARNRALREADGEWIVFADDDLRFDPGWLSAWLGALRDAQNAAYAGGRILPDWGVAPPAWHRGERLALIDGALGWYDLGGDVRPLGDDDPSPFGGNMAIRRKCGLDMNGFRGELGVSGRALGRGEESDFFLRVRRAGGAGLYVGTALCHHRFEPARFRPSALFHYGVATGLAHRAIVDANASGSWRASFGHLARGGVQLLKGRGDRFRQCVVNAGVQAALAPHSPFSVG